MAEMRAYRPDEDFLRIRDFLVEIYDAAGAARTWDLCRWEQLVTVWEDNEAGIVGVVHTEEPWRGEAWLQGRPGWNRLLEEMVAHAEATLSHEGTGRLSCPVFDHDEELIEVLTHRGYRKRGERRTYCDSVFDVGDLRPPALPEGFVVRSMVDDPDIEARRKVLGLAFDHSDPQSWASAFTYEELMRAPDYRPDLDLFVDGPDGARAACCVVWLDEHNRMATPEPAATRPVFRGQGLGREVVMEGIRRAAALGAERVGVGTDLLFYLAIGFKRRSTGHTWSRQV